MPALSTTTIANSQTTLTLPRTQGHLLSKQSLNSQIPAATQHHYRYPQPYTKESSATTSETQVQSRRLLKPTTISTGKNSGLGLTLDSSSETLYNAHSRNMSAASSSSSLVHDSSRRLTVRRATPADALGIARVCLHAVSDDAERRRPGPSTDNVGQADNDLHERSSSSASDGSVASRKDEAGIGSGDSSGKGDEEDVDAQKIKSVCKRMRHAELPAAVRALPYLHLRSGFVFVLVESIPEGGPGVDAPTLATSSQRAAPLTFNESRVKDVGIGGSTDTIKSTVAGPSTTTSAPAQHLWERRAAHLENLRMNAYKTQGSINGHGRGESVASNASTAISTTSGVSAFTMASATTARTSMGSTASTNIRQISRKPSKPMLAESITASPASSFLELGPSSLISPRGPRLPSSPLLSPLPECDRPLSAISNRSSRSSFRNSMHSPAKPRGPRPLPKPPALSRGMSAPAVTTSYSSPGPAQSSVQKSDPIQIPKSNEAAVKGHKNPTLIFPIPPPPPLRLPPRPSLHELQTHPYSRLTPETPLKFLPALTPPPPPPPPLVPQPPALTLPSHHPSSPPKRNQASDPLQVTSASTSASSVSTSKAKPAPANVPETSGKSVRYTERIVGYVLGTPHSARFAAEADARWWPRLRKLYPREMQGTPLDRYFVARIHSRQIEKERREKERELIRSLNGKRTRRREKGRGVLRLSAKAGLVTTLSERGGVESEGDSSSSSTDSHGSSTRRDKSEDVKDSPLPQTSLPPLYAAARTLLEVQDAPADGGPPQLQVCVLQRVRDAEGGEGAAYERLLMDAAMRHLREMSTAEKDEVRMEAKIGSVAEQAKAGLKA